MALDKESVDRLDALAVEEESSDETITDPINVYEAEELTLLHTGDEY